MQENIFKDMTVEHLLKSHSLIMNELIGRGVIRTRNKPTGDYAEWLIAQKLNLKLTDNSYQGYDAIDNNGIRYQIKSRQLARSNASRQLSVIRDLEKLHFDFLIAVFFHLDFSIESAFILPHKIIDKYAKYSIHQNGHILIMSGRILQDNDLINITPKLL